MVSSTAYGSKYSISNPGEFCKLTVGSLYLIRTSSFGKMRILARSCLKNMNADLRSRFTYVLDLSTRMFGSGYVLLASPLKSL